MDDVRVEKVLRAAECVPAGYAATYGDLAEITGESPRAVGQVMARWGANVAWWRICNARGEIPGHLQQALPHWSREGLELTPAGTGIRLMAHRLPVERLRKRWRAAITDL